jgi:DHA1 family tetracycline resistance protein-like MFS transporter
LHRAGRIFILITVFLDVLGIGIVIPILPPLIATFVPDRDLQSYWYGALLASYGLLQFFSAPLLGALSDRFGRRSVLLISIFGLGLTFLLTALAPNIWVLLVARLLGGAAGSSYSVAGAYMADITSPEDRSRGFGQLGALFGIGFIFGPMLGGLLAQSGLRTPYFAAAALSLVNWLYGLFVLPESLPLDRRTKFSLAKANPFSALLSLAQVPGVGALIAVYTLTAISQYLLQSTWVLYTTFRFGWGPLDNGLSLFAFGAASAASQAVLLGILLKRFGDKRTALIGLASSCIAHALYGLAFQGWMLYAIICANLLGYVTGPALQGIVSRNVDPQRQGVTLGSLNSINSIVGVVVPLVGTSLLAAVAHFERTDPRIGAPFFLAATIQAVAFLLAGRFSQ